MKNLLIVLITILITSVGCDEDEYSENKSKKRELVPNPEKYEHDNCSFENISFVPDTSVNGLVIINSESTIEYLGISISDKLKREKGYLPNIKIETNNSKQILRVICHPGGGINEIVEFEIEFSESFDRTIELKVEQNQFITESGIRLNITVGDLKVIKGKPDSISKGETTIFHYEINDYEKSEFLKKYNYPVYYSDYEFQNGYLTRFKFGFEYP